MIKKSQNFVFTETYVPKKARLEDFPLQDLCWIGAERFVSTSVCVIAARTTLLLVEFTRLKYGHALTVGVDVGCEVGDWEGTFVGENDGEVLGMTVRLSVGILVSFKK